MSSRTTSTTILCLLPIQSILWSGTFFEKKTPWHELRKYLLINIFTWENFPLRVSIIKVLYVYIYSRYLLTYLPTFVSTSQAMSCQFTPGLWHAHVHAVAWYLEWVQDLRTLIMKYRIRSYRVKIQRENNDDAQASGLPSHKSNSRIISGNHGGWYVYINTR